MSGFIDVPINDSMDDIIQTALTRLMDEIPGWIPREGHLEVMVLEEMARMVSIARVSASRVPRAIFRYFGRSLIGIQPVDGARAQVGSTWTMRDAQGYTIPAGTVVGFRVAGDRLVGFKVVADVVVPPGDDTTGPHEVELEALDVGTAANGLTGTIELVDTLAFVESITTAQVTAGGADAESDDEYLNRLAQELELLSPTPILPEDFAVLARRIPGVHRAMAVDGYDPDTDTFDNERMVHVVAVDEDGNGVSPTLNDEIKAYLEARREVNFIVSTGSPTTNLVDVATTVKALPGFLAATVQAAVVERLTTLLDKATWGGGAEDPPEWRPTATVIRYNEMIAEVDRVEGVDYVASLTLNGGTADVTMTGVAPLPELDDLTVTVT